MGRLYYGYWLRKEKEDLYGNPTKETSLEVIEKIMGDDSQRANKRKVRRVALLAEGLALCQALCMHCFISFSHHP